jgi:hypothetical protein
LNPRPASASRIHSSIGRAHHGHERLGDLVRLRAEAAAPAGTDHDGAHDSDEYHAYPPRSPVPSCNLGRLVAWARAWQILTIGIVTDLHFGPEARWQGKLRKLTHRAGALARDFVPR